MSECINILEHDNRRRGFFSVIILTLHAIELCNKYNLNFNLNVLKLYGDGKQPDGNWSYFFKPFKYCSEANKTLELSSAEWFKGRPGINEFTQLSEYIKKYIKLNDNIITKIQEHIELYNIKDCVGIHIRRTDHFTHGQFVDFSVYENIIKQEIDQKNKVFIATDDTQTVEHFKKYEDNVIFTDSLRVTGNMGIHWWERKKTDEENLKSGYDVLLDTILLSYCKRTYFTNSNIATYAIANSIANSNNLEYVFIDNNIEYH